MNDDEHSTSYDELIQKLKHDWNQIFSHEVSDRIIQIVPIKKTYPMKPAFLFPEHNMYYFFEQYGEVESTNIRFEDDDNFHGFIQLKNSKVADNLVERGRISIGDIEFQVKPSNESEDDQPTNVSIIECFKNLTLIELEFEPLRQDTQNNILTVLNDDCLRLIFQKFHRLSDFHSISNVCMQFNRISKDIFPTKIKQQHVNFIDLMHDVGEITLPQIELFLSNFGSSIFCVCITFMSMSYLRENIPDASNILLQLIYKHCKNLRELQVVVGVPNITKETLLEIRPLLSQLKCLRINLSPGSDFGPFNDCLVHCTQLETLEMNGLNRTQYTLPAITFPKLIKFEKTADDISSDEFLAHNPQLEELIIKYSSKLCEIIANKLSNLRTLFLQVDKNVFTEMDNIHLRHLKHVNLDLYLNIDDSIRNLYIFPMKNITKLWLYVS